MTISSVRQQQSQYHYHHPVPPRPLHALAATRRTTGGASIPWQEQQERERERAEAEALFTQDRACHYYVARGVFLPWTPQAAFSAVKWAAGRYQALYGAPPVVILPQAAYRAFLQAAGVPLLYLPDDRAGRSTAVSVWEMRPSLGHLVVLERTFVFPHGSIQ